MFCSVISYKYLNENKLQYSIDMYSSGSELIGLKDKIVNYDIVFLDINMTGIDNIKVSLASCCDPVYGDSIVGYITKGNGISIYMVE